MGLVTSRAFFNVASIGLGGDVVLDPTVKRVPRRSDTRSPRSASWRAPAAFAQASASRDAFGPAAGPSRFLKSVSNTTENRGSRYRAPSPILGNYRLPTHPLARRTAEGTSADYQLAPST